MSRFNNLYAKYFNNKNKRQLYEGYVESVIKI